MAAVVRWLGIFGLAVVGVAVLVTVAARFHDGPLAIIAGGPLEAGEMVDAAGVDWSFIPQVREVEFQLLDPPRSRTVWIVQVDGELYVPCGYLSASLWKKWPHEAEVDGRAIFRIDGKRYAFQLTRMQDPAIYQKVAARVSEKYAPGDAFEADPKETWFFQLKARS